MATCGSCGTTLADGNHFCPACGQPVAAPTVTDTVPPPPPPPPAPPGYSYAPTIPPATGAAPVGSVARTNGFAIASLVLGCVGIFTCGLGSVLAVIFGFIARNQIRQRGEQGNGMALAGIILGFVFLALFVIYVIVVAITASGDGGMNQNY